jgi:cytoskeletal protein CcmA (bactofilin family)
MMKYGLVNRKTKGMVENKSIGELKQDNMYDDNSVENSSIGARKMFTGTGTINVSGNYRIDNFFSGSIRIDGNLIIEAGGIVTGYIEADKVTIYGYFIGTAKIKSILDLNHTAVVSGKIHTGKAIISSKAVINGMIITPNKNMHDACLSDGNHNNSKMADENLADKNFNTNFNINI